MIRDKRRHEIKVRYDDTELATLKGAASAARVPLAVYIRERSFGRTPKPPTDHPAIVGDLINELLKIATNFGQLARWTDDATQSDWVNQWESVMRETYPGYAIRGEFAKAAALENFAGLVEQGRLLNEIARVSNTEKKAPDPQRLDAVGANIAAILDKIFPPDKPATGTQQPQPEQVEA